MQDHNLPSPNIGGKGFHLRRIAAQAISQQEVSALNYPGGLHPEQATLARFFAAAVDAAQADGLITPVPSFTPQLKTYSIGAGATAGPTLDKNGSAGAATYSSSNTGKATVNSSTGAVTGVEAGTAYIIVSLAATATYRAITVRYPITVTA